MEQNLGALKGLDKGGSVSVVAKNLEGGKSKIGDWKNKWKEIQSWYVVRICTEALKKKGKAEGMWVNEELNIWFRQRREKDTPIRRPVFQEKAIQFYVQ